jgi:hypothetical protein
MGWREYVIEVTGTDNQSAIARMLGDQKKQSMVGRWFAGSVPTIGSVVDFADRFERDYTEAFLAAAGKDWTKPPSGPVVARAPRSKPRKATPTRRARESGETPKR